MTATTASTDSPPSVRPAAPRRAWIVIAALAALLIGLGAGLLIGRGVASPTNPPEAIPSSVTTMLADRVAAINEGSADDIAAFYTQDAVLEEHDQQPAVATTGGTSIGEHLNTYRHLGFRIQQTGTATRLGPFVAEPLLWSDGYGGYAVYRLAQDGRIAHQWVMGGPIPGATGP